MIVMICLGISLLALIIAFAELEHERTQRERHAAMWIALNGQIPEALGGTPWTRRQAA